MGWWITIGAGVVAIAVITLICFSEIMGPRDENIPMPTTVRPVRPTTQRPQWNTVWIHSLPARPFTTEQAHEVMQLHLDCDPMMCPRKRLARQTLINAGTIRLRQRVR